MRNHLTAHMLRPALCCIAVCVALLLGATQTAQADPISFRVTVNTSALMQSNPNGFLDLQFNPSTASAPPATAVVTGFASIGGTLGAATRSDNESVQGTLPGTVTFRNTTGFNDLFQEITFGSNFSFNLMLDVVVTSGMASSSEFTLFVFGDDEQTALLSNSMDGRLLSVLLNADGSTLVQTFGSSPGVITVQPAAAVPEPATMLLLGTGLAGILARSRRKTSVRVEC